MRTLSSFAVIGLCYVSCAWPQETVSPDINARFENPNVEQYIAMFEGDGRAIYANRHAILEVLELQPGMDVADVGAGTGFFSRMIAEEVGPEGNVYAVDISEPFLEHISETADEAGLTNIELVLCDQHSTKLPADSVDAVFICDTYHHFEHPEDTMASIHAALRENGKLVIVDFERIEGVTTPFSIEHVRAGKGTFTDEIKDAGFDYVREADIMDDQYVLVFTKRTAPPASEGAADRND